MEEYSNHDENTYIIRPLVIRTQEELTSEENLSRLVNLIIILELDQDIQRKS
jgi:hypothetical protein